MPIYQIDGVVPVVSPLAFVHPTAVVIGDVIIEANCYIGPCAVLRGDFGPIRVKKNANLQDTCVMHGYPNVVTSIEEFGHVGHGAILHGCIVGKDALVGMNAVVMDESVIGEGSIVGAMSFVKAGVVFPEQSLIVGSPAKVIRKVSAEELKWKKQGTKEYIELAKRSQETMIETSPLSEPEPNRKVFAIDHITLAQTKKK